MQPPERGRSPPAARRSVEVAWRIPESLHRISRCGSGRSAVRRWRYQAPLLSVRDHSQVVVGIDEELEIRPHFLEPDVSQIMILFQPVEIGAPPGFKSYNGIAARFATSHAQDLQQRPFVKLVVELVFVNEEQIGHEREIKLVIAKRQPRQLARHVPSPPPRSIIGEESSIGSLAKSAQRLRRLVEIPAISLEAADGLGHLVQIGFAAALNFIPAPFVDRIERRHVEPQSMRLGAEGTDPGRDIEDCLAAELSELERKVLSILFQRASQQHNFVQYESLFHRRRGSSNLPTS